MELGWLVCITTESDVMRVIIWHIIREKTWMLKVETSL